MWAYTCPAEKDVAWPSDLSICYQSIHFNNVNTLYCLLNRFIGRYRQHLAHINDSMCIKALAFAAGIFKSVLEIVPEVPIFCQV